MSILEDLRKLSAAEEFFDILGVEYDPTIVRHSRLHILRRMGEYLHKAAPEGATDEEVRESCRNFLAQAYQDFTTSTPIEQRLFKVHKDAVKPKEEPKKPFVPLNTLTTSNG
ncbi:nitrogenase stabilizing/protective protein NifW [Methylosinus sp. Ce-a6]|uniref:nitrogenase stabilizing/protective protein NifW n=1 Tax=Methylosinus sp. Ce-a6 TaxID=2172005 RepID=UPI00135A6D75|nr:nitrogenase stabilizing/protective protein NifW [Methylosinus sp. Ce-a6]